MTITEDIKKAIKRAIDQHGNVTQFAKSLGLAHSTVLFWLSGKTATISGLVWAQKLRPALVPYMISDKQIPTIAGPPESCKALEELIRRIVREELQRDREERGGAKKNTEGKRK